jgi:hypothetical protein
MAYVVIVCSGCRLARGAAETAKTASCPKCGRKLRVAEVRKYFRSESLDQLREAIGQLNARLKGGLDIYLDDLYRSIPETSAKPDLPPRLPEEAEEARQRKDDERLRQSGRAVPQNKLDRAIVMCLMGRPPLTSGELLPLLPIKCTIEQLDRRLEGLRRSGMLYEPKAGNYALVGGAHPPMSRRLLPTAAIAEAANANSTGPIPNPGSLKSWPRACAPGPGPVVAISTVESLGR